MATFRNVGVVGSGQMGSGIAQVIAGLGVSVVMVDISKDALDRAVTTIQKSCNRLIKKGTMSETQKGDLMRNLKTSSVFSDLKGCDLVIEAATEKESLKFELFRQLDKEAPNAILCSNTSSISITQIAAQTKRPHQVAGLHFMNPVPVMKLVEGIRGLQTSDETFEKLRKFTNELDKTFVEAKDMPGFVVNRILMPMINEAVFALSEGLASPADIDQAMKLGTNQPMGPLALADFIGLDTCLAIMNVLYDGFADSKYRPSALLKKYVEAGWLGRKTGRGFYTYETI